MKKKDISTTNKLLNCIMVLLFLGCAKEPPLDYSKYEPAPVSHAGQSVTTMKYAIQVGAFSKLDYALRLTEKLNKKGLHAYYFAQKSGLYKVRFGDYLTYQKAQKDAEKYIEIGQIADFYIVKPEEFAVAKKAEKGEEFVRENLIATAESFLGLPYKWGGASSSTGFDCSGLSMVVYKINGINLPRNSRSQYKAGRKVRLQNLRRGDLVFFATSGGKKVSHVGIYKGKGKFIHAPKKGKKIEVSSLDIHYFKSRFVGAKTYL